MLFSFAAAMMLSGCAIESEPEGSQQTAVEFTGNLNQILTRVGGTDGTTWHAADPVGIYMVKADPGTLSEGNIVAANKHYKASAGSSASFTPGDGTHLFYPSDGSGVKFTAYHPHTGTVSADHKVSFSVADQSNLSNIDLLHAPVTATFSRTSTGAVPLVFSHKLTKLIFNVSNGAGVTEPVANGIEVAISGQQTAGTLDLANGGAIAATGATSVLTASGAAIIEAIVLPNTDLSDVTFTFTNDAGQSFLVDSPAASWQGGKQYTYTVTLKAAEKSSEISGSIDPWGNGGTETITGEEQTGNPAGRIRMSLDPTGLTRAGGGSIGFGIAGTGMVTIEWGDDERTTAPINTSTETFFPHTYAESAVYEVTVSGDIWSLDCSRSGLIGLDISAAPGLVTLKCSGNKLTDFVHDELSLPALDLSGDTALTELVINTANTKTLDVSGCTALVNLTARPGSGKGALETLNVTGCTALEFLDCQYNRLTELNVSTNIALKTLYCPGNLLEELNVTQNHELSWIWCYGNELTELNLTGNPMLHTLWCSGNRFTELDLKQNNQLSNLECWDNFELTELNLSGNHMLGRLDCHNTGITQLDLHMNNGLSELICSSNNMTELNLSNMHNLRFLDCSVNQLLFLNLSNSPRLEYVDCSSNRINTIITKPENPPYGQEIELSELRVLQCSFNELESLDVRDYHRLEILVCNYQRRMDQYGYWVNNFCPLVSRENNFSLYLVDCRGNNLYFPSPENSEITVLDELLSSLPTEETPMPEIAIAPFRQIILSYDPNEFQPVIEPVNGWIVTQRDFMENDWDYCPVLNDNPIINTTYWPISLYDIKMWYDMMHGGVIWTRGNSKMPNSSSLMAFRQ